VPHPVNPKQRRGRGSLSRQEILEAALSIIQEEGPDKLSMRRIAARLSCSVASPYAHFENQGEIIRILIERGEKELTGELRQARDSSTDVYEQLRAIATTYWSFARDHRALHQLMFNVGTENDYRGVFSSLPTSYRVFLETIRRGIQSGAIRQPRQQYRAIARTMWGWMFGLIILDMTGMLRTPRSGDPIEEGIVLFESMLGKPE